MIIPARDSPCLQEADDGAEFNALVFKGIERIAEYPSEVWKPAEDDG